VRLAAQGGATCSTDPATPADDRLGATMLALLTGLRTRSHRRERPLETRWYEFLAYPFHDARLWVGPAFLLTAVSAVALLLIPRMFAQQDDGAVAYWGLGMSGVLGLVVAGFPCQFLGCVLRSAACGDGRAVRWTGHAVGPALLAALIGLGCFLAGPVVPAAVAAAYWMQCGDPGLLDGLILAELAILTVGYALLVLAAVSEHGRARDANPLHVIDLAHRLGWRAGVSAVVGSALALAHGLLAVVAAENLHRNGAIGVLLLAACWFSALYWATVLFRLLGVWCYRCRPVEPATTAPRRIVSALLPR
jgi:hypothetical protein